MTEIDINRAHRLPTIKNKDGLLKIAVIGGNGFLGRHFITELATTYSNLDIYSLDAHHLKNPIYIDTEGFKSTVNQITMPVHIPSVIRTWLWTKQPDIIVYAAGRAGPPNGLNRPENIALDMEALVGLNRTLEALSDIKPGYFMYISSYAVYGNHGKKPITEDSNLKPNNHVGQIRVTAEQIVQEYCRQFEIKHSIIRPSEIFGRHHRHELMDDMKWTGYVSFYVDSVVEAIEQLNREENSLPTLKSKSSVIRHGFSQKTNIDFVHVDYVCKVMTDLCVNRTEGTYNVSSNTASTIGSVLDLVLESLNEHPNLPYEGFQNKQLPYDKRSITKISNSVVVSQPCHQIVPYDQEKYDLRNFLDNYLPIRIVEMKQRRDYEEAVARSQILDTTGVYKGRNDKLQENK